MKKTLFFPVIAVIFVLGCAKKEDGSAQRLRVGTSNDYPPYCYLDPNGELAGFEKDVLDAIDKKLPEYRFTYEVLEFKNILTSLETGRIDIAAHQFGVNEERQQKFLFSNEGYIGSYSYIVVPDSTNDIHSLDDLRGKHISVPPASGWAYTVETYNAGHPDNPILIDYYEATPDVLITNMTAGVIDATLLTESDVKLINTFWPVNLKITGDPVGDFEESHFVFQKNADKLHDAVDRAIRELKDSGELEAIQKKAVDDFFKNAGRQ
ncbi:MAG: transporter substrate-binding domain-containing protein [Spirochaetaceae bacterium]|jgi:L-cystine transport system substrate-binding protein|nr:transporter substrate-binding domain-containing protein [Spirochaetaceae bacterium]